MNKSAGCPEYPPTPAATDSRLLKMAEVQGIAGLSRRFLFDQIKSGELPVVKFSPRAIRIQSNDLDAFILRHRTAGRKESFA